MACIRYVIVNTRTLHKSEDNYDNYDCDDDDDDDDGGNNNNNNNNK
jgi:hypothetical protein